MKGKRIYSDDEVNDIISMYQSGMSLYKISENFKSDKKIKWVNENISPVEIIIIDKKKIKEIKIL